MLLVDNGSVFTKNISKFLSDKEIDFSMVSFDKITLSKLDEFDSFVLSGRRQNNKQMNTINSKIIQHSISEKKPLLGICYGAEILALTVGGTIRKMNSIQKGENEVTVLVQNPLCSGKIHAYQSHSYEISRPGQSLKQIAKSDACNYEIVQYENYSIYGTQFHPEMSKDGLLIIEKFAKL